MSYSFISMTVQINQLYAEKIYFWHILATAHIWNILSTEMNEQWMKVNRKSLCK